MVCTHAPAQGFDGQTVFFAYFVPTEQSLAAVARPGEAAAPVPLRRRLEDVYGAERTRALLEGASIY